MKNKQTGSARKSESHNSRNPAAVTFTQTNTETHKFARIAVIGNAAGGKTTMCTKIGAHLGLEVYQLDLLQWKPGGMPAPLEEFTEQHNELVRKDHWIIDGWGSWESIELRFAAADTIILINHRLHVHYWWLFKRQVPHIILTRLSFAEKRQLLIETWKLVKAMWQVHRLERQKLIEVLDSHRGVKRIIHIGSPKELNEFIAGVCSSPHPSPCNLPELI